MMNLDIHERNNPSLPAETVITLAERLYGLEITAIKPLDSYADQNFYLKDRNGKEFVFKIANPAETGDVLDMQLSAMHCLAEKIPGYRFPTVCTTLHGQQVSWVEGPGGTSHLVHVLSYLPGKFLDEVQPHPRELLHDIGSLLGKVDETLSRFSHRAANRFLIWDVKQFRRIMPYLETIENARQRSIVEHFLLRFDTSVVPLLPDLRQGVIYNDANDANILVEEDKNKQWVVRGLIDFGDMLYSYLICELAIAAAYACLGKTDVMETTCLLLGGYHKEFPLTDQELWVLLDLVCARLSISVTLSAFRSKLEPGNRYITVSEQPAWEALEKFMHIEPWTAYQTFRSLCGRASGSERLVPPEASGWSSANLPQPKSPGEILTARKQFLNPSLSVSYKKPLKIVRGWRQYLYDDQGRSYVDCVNNVCHVGHCHPRVVRAAQVQNALLNTNTRYLHDNIVAYAERLCSTLPHPLRVCFFVNSGSEANDLALRLARTHTRSRETIVIDHAYHGNLSSLIEISPYKFDGRGGSGPAPHIHKVSMPDVYRGPFKATDREAGSKYAAEVEKICARLLDQGKKPGAFIVESLPGVGGQIVLPDKYLPEAFQYVRAAGGVCIADEVQVGFGRVGTHFWGFESQGVVPDIVTFGKPIGNGHPLGAVVTTPEIAASFHNGMEYFNTYGGNPVSCAVGLAVLEVIAAENLQQNALETGAALLSGLQELGKKYHLIGDVRGLGLFIGIELVRQRDTLEPADEEAAMIIEAMKERGILLSVDGPLHNVIKIKPPIVFDKENAASLVTTLDEILGAPGE